MINSLNSFIASLVAGSFVIGVISIALVIISKNDRIDRKQGGK